LLAYRSCSDRRFSKERARPFYILDEVNQSNSYPYVSGMSAITTIALAGGFTARAKRSAMTISRSDDDSGRSIDATAEVLPGDILVSSDEAAPRPKASHHCR
jgi:protein involved in polysaccharide export with SLBB domain